MERFEKRSGKEAPCSGPPKRPKHPLTVYLIVKQVMTNLEVGDLVRCWSVNSLFRAVAQPFIDEMKIPFKLRQLTQVAHLMNRLEEAQDQGSADPDPLFPPNKFDIQIRRDDNKFTSSINDVWIRFGRIATQIDINFDPNGCFDWIPQLGTNDPASVICLTQILDHCPNLESLSVYMRYNIAIPKEFANHLPSGYPRLKRLQVKSTLTTGVKEDEVDLIEFLLGRTPGLDRLLLAVGHRFLYDHQDTNQMLPEWLQRVTSRTGVELSLTVTSLDEDVLRKLTKLPPRVHRLNVAVSNYENVNRTHLVSQALSQWISSLRPTLQYLKIVANGAGDLSMTSMEQLRELKISLIENSPGASHTLRPVNFPRLEKLRFNSIVSDWSFQEGFRTVKELSLCFDVEDSPKTPIPWNLAFPNVESLKIDLWTGGSDQRPLYIQTASLLDSFRNVLHLELDDQWTKASPINRDESVFNLLTGHEEFQFGAEQEIRVVGFSSKGALAKLGRLKTLRAVRPSDSTIKALLFSSVNGGLRRLERLTIVHFNLNHAEAFRQRLGRFHEKVECMQPTSVSRDDN